MVAARIGITALEHIRDDELFLQLGQGYHEGALRVIQAGAPPEDLLFRYLDTVGDGSGTKNANGDYSSVAQDFKITTQPNISSNLIQALNIHIRDGSALSANEYGNVAALTNGVSVKIHNASNVAVIDLTDGIPVKSNAGWSRGAFNMRADDFGSGDNFISAQWHFNDPGSWMSLPTGYSLRVHLNDNLSGLIDHYFFVTGHVHRTGG